MAQQRVLVTVPPLGTPGGVTHYYETLRAHLPEEIEYFQMGSRTQQDPPLQTIVRMVRDYCRFIATLLVGRYDIVHVNPSLLIKAVCRDAVFLLLGAVLAKRTLVFFRGWDPAFGERLFRNFRGLFAWAYFRADAMVVLASAYRETLQSIGYRKPVFVETTVVADAVFDGFQQTPGESADDSVNLLFLARIDRYKGVYGLLDAFARLRASFPSLVLNIAGDGPERENMLAYIDQRGIGNVRYLGYVTGKAKAQAFRMADIYLLLSDYEGMPNSLLEAMAFGLPVVSTPVGGVKDFFEDGRMGWLVERADPELVADRLAALLENPALRRSIGDYNRDYARRRFAASAVAQRLLQVYQQVSADA